MTNPTTLTTEPGVPFVDIVREFDAPVADVYRAYTDPTLVSQWMGPRGYTTKIIDYDVRSGGSWNFVHVDPDGDSYEFRGVFHTVTPELIVQTFEYAGVPNHVSLESVTFEDAGDGRTRVRSRSAFQSVEDRDGMVASGMGQGVVEGFERMDEVLAGF
jgi:uncharacterized protein YndB with AHSA1/START domain